MGSCLMGYERSLGSSWDTLHGINVPPCRNAWSVPWRIGVHLTVPVYAPGVARCAHHRLGDRSLGILHGVPIARATRREIAPRRTPPW